MRILLTLCLLMIVSAAHAALLSSDAHGRVTLDGPIVQGDAEQLIALQRSRHKAKQEPLRTIFLSSAGGSVAEAVRIAGLIEAFRLDTFVPTGTSCVSSCFILFVAGSSRTAMGAGDASIAGKVGVHRPIIDLSAVPNAELPKVELQQRSLMRSMQEFLVQKGVTHELIEKMMRYSSQEVYWLTDADLVSLGAYSATYDELIVSRCGRSPDFGRTLFNPSGSFQADNSIEKMDELNACQVRVVGQLRSVEVPALLKRFDQGWRPWTSQRTNSSSTK